MIKNLYFLRHGIAVPRGTPGIRDADRPLTERGEERLIRSVKGMRQLGLKFDLILSSPLTRAYQTAQIVKVVLPFTKEIEIEETLTPEGSLSKFIVKMKKRKESEILLTGHEPAMSSWIQDLLRCGDSASVQMKKGALCQLRVDLQENPPEAELEFLLQPRILRRLG